MGMMAKAARMATRVSRAQIIAALEMRFSFLGTYDPYVMIYERPTAPKITRHLQRWVNNKRIFHTVKDFKDYAPMKKEVH